jgi:chemotaxis protein MotA
MQITSFIGFIAGITVVGFGLSLSHAAKAFISLHGLVIVLGGTLSAVIFHSEGRHLLGALKGIGKAFTGRSGPSPEILIPALAALAEKAKLSSPAVALQSADPALGGGFVGIATRVAQQNLQEPETVRNLLLRHVHAVRHESNEIVNVFRVASIMSPMFGLIGTLIGIIEVLRNITSPEAVGVAMGTAITSAFYGITLANLVCVPFAGKLRSLMLREAESQSIVAEGVADIVKGEMPLVVEQRLWTLVDRGMPPAAR